MKIGANTINNCKIGSVQVNEVRIGSTLVWSGFDADAQLFITNAAITDTTQQNAVNNLVVALKGYGIWTKMKALYPFVGGTASQHKFNLKNPLDTDAAFRLGFNGGITHNSNGVTLNGVNAFALTYFNAITNNLTNGNISIYNRTNNAGSYYDFSNLVGAFEQTIIIKFTDNKFYINSGSQTYPNFVNSDARGLYAMNYNSTNIKGYKNGSVVITENKVSTGVNNIYTIGRNSSGQYSNRNYAFASISDGLTDTESANMYTAVQAFQTSLNRQIGVPIVSDSDAQAFLNAAVIEDITQANAVNTLVTDLKTYGIWTKMKALYPFVGGTASQHKFNLKNPLDTDAAFRLVFNGGWTHSSTGALPNGTNAFASTYVFPPISLSSTSAHMSYYSRTSMGASTQGEIGVYRNAPNYLFHMHTRYTGNIFYGFINTEGATSYANTQTQGLFIATRRGATDNESYRNGVSLGSNSNVVSANPIPSIYDIVIGALNNVGTIGSFSTKECAIASIGDGLTDTEAANYYTAVQAFQTTLSRNV